MNVKIAKLNVTIKDFFFKWLELNKSFHKLKPQDQKVLSLLLYYHFIYQKDIRNEKVLWKILFDYDTKILIRNDEVFKNSELSSASMENSLSRMRKMNIIVDNKISARYIPNISKDSEKFAVIYEFNIVKNDK